MTFNPNPRDPTVLHSQTTHISSDISEANMDATLFIKRLDNVIWGLFNNNIIHPRVCECLHHMGLYGILRCGYHVLDHHLITALVERWRRETHTFHLRVGEATITLQDVQIIWGLKVDGKAVTGKDTRYKRNEWQQICLDWLGFAPETSEISGGHLLMSALDKHCRHRPIQDLSTDEEIAQYSRCVALLIIGGCMLPDTQGGAVKLMYLQILREISRVNEYSWGSATLAYLYRELCNASTIGKRQIAGPLYILQIWAWSRMPVLGPDQLESLLIAPGEGQSDAIMPIAPYGARWKSLFTYTHMPTYSVRIIREILDCIEDNQFRWTLYDFGAPDLPPSLSPEQERTTVWRALIPLICFDIVEMHRPNRVMRQFVMRQSIPEPVIDGDELHRLTRQGRSNFDWAFFHRDYLLLWLNRRTAVVSSDYHYGVNTTTHDYKRWYDCITVRFISPTAGRIGYRTGDAYFRNLVRNEGEILMHRLEGLSLRDQSHEVLEQVIEDDRRIGRCLYSMANREPLEHEEGRRSTPPQSQRQQPNRRRYRQSSRSSSSSYNHHIMQRTRRETAGPSHTTVEMNQPTNYYVPQYESTSYAQPSYYTTFIPNIHPNEVTSYDQPISQTPYPPNLQNFTELLNSDYLVHQDDM